MKKILGRYKNTMLRRKFARHFQRIQSKIMRFSYNKLCNLLVDRNINKQKSKELSGISLASVAKLGKVARASNI